MNALTKAASGGAVANADFANPFAAAGAGAGNTTYMKFKGASGDFLFGQDEEEMPHGSTFAGDIENSKWVWSFWWEGEVLETIETRVAQNPLGFENEPDHLPDDYEGDMTLEEIRAAQADRKTNFMDGWSCQAVLGLREIGGEAEEFTLKLNQGVALNAFRTLLSNFGRAFRFKVGLVPVIELGARSYVSKNKSVGKRYNPILKIVDWRSEEDLMAAAGEDPDMYDDAPERDDPPARAAKAETKAIEAPKDEAPADETPRPRGRGARGAANYG
ncbi:hypothetical protein vBRpoSV10_79 [Ruegeria phage vB_RpoS-V10]|nr:hypothetical protein DSS3P8_079 [Roseobacter phage DSS3P8]AWY09201.1 hypothetical protein vBRpoSV10_79 [Ruegeria phage vB_RpoS-V10]